MNICKAEKMHLIHTHLTKDANLLCTDNAKLERRLSASKQIHHAVSWAQELHKIVKSSNAILQELRFCIYQTSTLQKMS